MYCGVCLSWWAIMSLHVMSQQVLSWCVAVQLANQALLEDQFEYAILYCDRGLQLKHADRQLRAKLFGRRSIACRLCEPSDCTSAVLDCSHALLLDPGNLHYLHSRALAYTAMGAYSKAVEVSPTTIPLHGCAARCSSTHDGVRRNKICLLCVGSGSILLWHSVSRHVAGRHASEMRYKASGLALRHSGMRVLRAGHEGHVEARSGCGPRAGEAHLAEG